MLAAWAVAVECGEKVFEQRREDVSVTREAAARLVAAGRRSHDLTVDLIYAEIKQGSRTCQR